MSQKTTKSIQELRELFTRGDVGDAAKISGPLVRIFEVSMKSNKEFVFRDFHEQTCLESTQEYSYDTEEDVSDGEKIKTSKRPYSEAGDLDEGPIPKKRTPKEGEKTTEEKKPEVVAHNSIADTLLCSICLDIFHDCVSLQPCTHTFCAACYTRSRDYSNYCPICRASIERVSNNFRVNDIVEAFLKEHPERRRSADELREMDSRKNIPEEMVVQEHHCTIL